MALLIWIQLFAPFVHAHSGATVVGGWHLHGSHPLPTASALTAPSPARWSTVALRQEPDSDSPEVGLATGVPQSRTSATPSHRLLPLAPPPSRPALHPPDVASRHLAPAWADQVVCAPIRERPGLPAQAHAPPARA